MGNTAKLYIKPEALETLVEMVRDETISNLTIHCMELAQEIFSPHLIELTINIIHPTWDEFYGEEIKAFLQLEAMSLVFDNDNSYDEWSNNVDKWEEYLDYPNWPAEILKQFRISSSYMYEKDYVEYVKINDSLSMPEKVDDP